MKRILSNIMFSALMAVLAVVPEVVRAQYPCQISCDQAMPDNTDPPSLLDMISGGGMIIIPEGTFEVTSTIQIPSNTKIVGTNGRTVIKAVGANTIFDISGGTENVELDGITFEGNLTNDSRILTPTVSELQTEQAFSEKLFIPSQNGVCYNSNNGKIATIEISGWSIMAPIEYNGGDVIINQSATSIQKVLFCCDAEGNILNQFNGTGTSQIKASNINSDTKYLYWNATTSDIPIISMFLKDNPDVEKGIGLHIHGTSVKKVTINNCIFNGFPYAGIRISNTLGNGYRDATKINLCRFQKNTNGIIFAERAEFATVVNCEFSHNQIGVWTCASNTNFGSCQISQNFSDGIVFVGGYQNSVHTVVSNCEIVHNGFNAGNTGELHNTYDIAFIGAVAGISITGCLIGIDGILLYNSQGVLITSCQLICPIFIEKERGCNAIHDNMWRKHANLGTIINGPTVNLSLKNNRFSDGSSYSSINNNN